MTNFRLGTAVKKGIALFPILGIFFLPACGALRLMLEVPTQVEIDGNTYITGFYGDDLWPTGLSFTGEECEVEGNLFRFMDWEPFNCVQAPIGWKTSGPFTACPPSGRRPRHTMGTRKTTATTA